MAVQGLTTTITVDLPTRDRLKIFSINEKQKNLNNTINYLLDNFRSPQDESDPQTT